MPKGLRFSVALLVGSSYKKGLKIPSHSYTLAILFHRKTIRFEALYLVLFNGYFGSVEDEQGAYYKLNARYLPALTNT